MDDKERSFNPVTPATKNDIRPGFLGGNGDGGSNSEKSSNNSQGSAAADDLKAAENAAGSTTPKKSEEGLSGVRKDEEEAGGLYSGTGVNKEKNAKKRRFGGVLKKRGPIISIFMMLFGVGGMMGATQLFQPFSLVAQFQETFNSMHGSANMRSNVFFRMQMDSGRVKNPIKGRIFRADTFKITKNQSAKLAAQGIEYDDDYNGTGVRVLKYTDDQGQMKIVVADEADIKKVGAGAVDFKKLYADNSDFFNRYNAGSMTWRGAIANWFGTITNKFLRNNNLSRNTFDDYQKKVAENDGNTKAAVQEILSTKTDELRGGGFETRKGIDEVTETKDANGDPVKDADGNPVTERTPSDAKKLDPKNTSGYDNNNEGVREHYEGKTSIKAMDVNAKLNDIAGSVQKGANITCTIGNIIGAVTLLVTAAEALQIINLTTAYFETVDKVKAGHGDDAPIHTLTNALNEKQPNENAELVFRGYNGELDSNGNIKDTGVEALDTMYISTNKTAMESSGIASLYGGGAVNTSDPSVKSFNFSSNIKRILGGIGVSMAGFKTCAIAKITANAVSGVTDAVSLIGCIAGIAGAAITAGIAAPAAGGACVAFVAKIAKSIAVSVAIGVVVSAVIATITPVVSNMLKRDLISRLGGEDLGNALTSGGNMYLGNAHRANGGSLGTKDKYVAFRVEQEKVIAENAKYERAALNPFDLTSKYTFMGTLLTQMMSFLTTNSLSGIVKTSSSVVSSALVSVLPSASAYNIASDIPDNYMDGYEETCPYLASIGAIGDAYCNPYSMTDTATIGYDPADVIDYLVEPSNLPSGSKSFMDDETSDGNVIINANSDLAKYILYCDNRESAFGIADQNIVSSVSNWADVRTESSTFNTVANSAIGAIPVLGDVIDVAQNSQALANIGYVSGESCVAGNDVNAAASPDWEQAKYYQRFIEDQSLAESIGLIEESAVTAFLDDYYEKNPLDNSYEGILARKSGLSKDTVVAILDLVEYGNYIANYNPSERYAFGEPVVEMDDELKFDNENVLAGAFVLLNQISFSDIRNRSFAV